MAQKKSYSRYFIILQEDEKGYSISSDKVASGYTKLELKNDKCKISYYVQNLKKESAPYYMLLICNKKDIRKVIKIAQINIDDYGRADICHEYLADNIAGTGISMDKISGAAIVKFLDSNIIPVMSGFASTEIPEWKTFSVVDLKVKEEKEQKPIEAPNSIFDKYEENIENLKQENKPKEIKNVENLPKENNMKKENKAIKKEDIKEKVDVKKKDNVKEEVNIEKKNNVKQEASIKKNDNVKEEVKVNNKDNIKEEVVIKKQDNMKKSENLNIENNIERSKSNNQHSQEEKSNLSKEDNINKQYNLKEDNNSIRQHKSKEKPKKDINISQERIENYPGMDEKTFFRNLVQGFECEGEVCSEIKRCKWYKVPVDSQRSMYDMSDYSRYSMIYYPMINYYQYIKKHQHYLIGYKLDKNEEMKYLVYAIAGTKSKMDQPYGGRSGFVTWMPLNGEDNREDTIGYWLMFYDFRTSTIIIPVKK
ncbi:hypothetical protein HBE96_02645 [Clostridium sp. P21]|uniref:Transmembrane protein n=1 Tax=Clostridium muellerianum TaxID=2716538 RepID=A0A7Y0EDP8_9CLOT|nr:hypothetical protein [Clostridium muellerianum]NMM61609.1 hypothetical protein [Clostridium muellerianum]